MAKFGVYEKAIGEFLSVHSHEHCILGMQCNAFITKKEISNSDTSMEYNTLN